MKIFLIPGFINETFVSESGFSCIIKTMGKINTLFLFFQDLRLYDNRGLAAAARENRRIFTMVLPWEGLTQAPVKNSPSMTFRNSSIKELGQEIYKRGGVLLRAGSDYLHDIKAMIKDNSIHEVHMNGLYDPGSLEMIRNIRMAAEKSHASFHLSHDYCLTIPGKVLSGKGEPYKVFSPFARKAGGALELEQITWGYMDFAKPGKISGEDVVGDNENYTLSLPGGRREGKRLLERLSYITDYKTDRDYPARDGISYLSAHLNRGTVSVREAYIRAGDMNGGDLFRRELLWRDFFIHAGYNFPWVFNGSFKREYDNLFWDDDPDKFQRWTDGRTGYPLVDAGMRQLRETGFMHNRVRMAAASFLVKDLHINWRNGEKYFADTLTDYEPAVNNGNWQWSASTGCDSVPYFRIMNPVTQQKRFDPEFEYIMRWVPEVEDEKDNFRPMVDHGKERLETLSRYRERNKII